VRFIRLTLLMALFLFSTELWSGAKESVAQSSSQDTYVVIISIDGVPAQALWDDRFPLPAIRSLAENGVWSTRMIPSTPTVTWPNHTTLVTGVFSDKHGVLTNGRFVRTHSGVGRYSYLDRSELTSYPAIYDIAYEAGLITAEVNWPVTRNTETLHFSLPDAPGAIRHTTPQFLDELLEAGILKDDTDTTFRSGTILNRDEIWTAAAEHLILNHQPNLMLFHLLNVDGTHHQYGEGTHPGFTALTLADSHVQRILNALDKAGIREQTTIFLVSDHGFMNVTREVHPNILLHKNGLIETDENGNVTDAKVYAVSNGGSAMVFSLNPETKEEDLEKARSVLSGAEGISHVLRPDEYHKYGLPQPEDNKNMGHLVLNASQHVSFGNAVVGENHIQDHDRVRGTHGYLSDISEMKTIFVASGHGVRSGVELGAVDNRSVAPTAARILGLVMEDADGEILESIIEN